MAEEGKSKIRYFKMTQELIGDKNVFNVIKPCATNSYLVWNCKNVSSAKANLNRPVENKQTGKKKLITWLLFRPYFTHNATRYLVFRNININISLVLSNGDLHFIQVRMEEMVEWACSSQSSTVLLAGFYEKTNKLGGRKMWPPRQR